MEDFYILSTVSTDIWREKLKFFKWGTANNIILKKCSKTIVLYIYSELRKKYFSEKKST